MAKLVDSSGKELIPFESGFSWIGRVPVDSQDYLIAARKDGKYGYINIPIVCEDGNNYELEDGDLSWPNMLCILGNKIVKKQQ